MKFSVSAKMFCVKIKLLDQSAELCLISDFHHSIFIALVLLELILTSIFIAQVSDLNRNVSLTAILFPVIFFGFNCARP